MFYKYRFQVCGLSFYSTVFFDERKLLILMWSDPFILYCLFKALMICFQIKTLLPFEMYSYILYEEEIQFLFILFPIWRTNSSGIIIEWGCLYLLTYSVLLVMSHDPVYMYGYMCGSVSGFPLLFHCSTCLSLCQFHCTTVVIIHHKKEKDTNYFGSQMHSAYTR